MTTNIDKAIEAAVREMNTAQSIQTDRHSRIIRSHIMPAVEVLREERDEAKAFGGNMLVVESNLKDKIAELELQLLSVEELTKELVLEKDKLKALGREYQGKHDRRTLGGHPDGGYLLSNECERCGSEIGIELEDLLCQNSDCIAFRHREACK